jgi:hypothetical protein
MAMMFPFYLAHAVKFQRELPVGQWDLKAWPIDYYSMHACVECIHIALVHACVHVCSTACSTVILCSIQHGEHVILLQGSFVTSNVENHC